MERSFRARIEHVEALAINHDPVTRKHVYDTLAANGIKRVRMAMNVVQALEQIYKRQPQLVIIDEALNGCSGIDVARKINESKKAGKYSSTVAVILLAQAATKALVDKAHEAGVRSLLLYPLDQELLRKHLQKIFN